LPPQFCREFVASLPTFNKMSSTKFAHNHNRSLGPHQAYILNNNNNNNIINSTPNNNNNSQNTNSGGNARTPLKRNTDGEYDYYRMDHNRLPFVVKNEGKIAEMDLLPMPPQDGFFYDINTYEKNDFDEPEPRWNPDLHLKISEPEYLVRMDTWEKVKSMESVRNRKDGTTETKLGFTSPFGLLTPEAVEIVRKICFRELGAKGECPKPRGNKRAVRGFWYTSPFIRDMMSCPKHLALLEKLTGEPVLPYFCYSNSPQINISRLGHKGTIDHWHFDGLKYVSVLMLSDMTQVTGGALEVMKCNKFEGLDKLERKESLDDLTYTVNYNRPGMCILNHGSNVLHHVTPITHNPKNIVRMSVIMAFSSANAYRPNELVIHTMTFCDAHSKLWGYEYFRYSAWQMMTVLKDMVENQKQVEDDQTYADHLRQVADELTRVAHQIENPHIDEIKYYHEDNAGLSSDHYERAKLQQIANLKNINLKENSIAANVNILKRVMAETENAGAWRGAAETEHPDVEEHFALR